MYECWQITDIGFLMNPAPLMSLSGYLADAEAQQLDHLIEQLPDLLEQRQVQQHITQLPLIDVSVLDDCRAIERGFQIYGYFATAYLIEDEKDAGQILPHNIAIPLATLAEKVQRPPILSYAPFTLSNWRKIDPDGEIEVDNLALVHKFLHLRDAEWFTLIHVDIEARAGRAVQAIRKIEAATAQEDEKRIIAELTQIHQGLDAMMRTLKRMPEHCHPKVYYDKVRPTMFGFDQVVFEGVEKYRGQPQSFLGETGAQSSIVPALVRLMGIMHEETSMTQYLRLMRDYMPVPHRQFIVDTDPNALRQFVLKTKNASLRDSYNHTLHQLLTFRKMHIRYAASYIANQSPDSLGTGGTEFMTWLQQLIDETETQLLT